MVDALIVFLLVELAALLGFLVGVFYARDRTDPPPAAGQR